jgi:DNA-binding MarR family transcriptional regulator
VADELERRIVARLREQGFDGLRRSHGYVVQRLIGGPQPVGALAADLGVTSQAVSGLVRELEDAGVVERTPGDDDRRVRVVALTPRGRAAVDAVRAARAAEGAELAAALGAERVEAARTFLVDVLAHTGALEAVRGRRVRYPSP